MTKRDFEMKSDGLGIGLFVFGTLNGVLVAQALLSGIEPESTRLVVKLAALWVQSIGALPSLLFNVIVAVLGALIFLNRAALPPWRHVVGGFLVALGLSVVCGAFSVAAGGLFGDLIGGTVARVHVALGALVGALIVAASLWFVWLRPGELPDEEPMSVRNPDREVALDTADDGVSMDEARALLPDDIQQALAQARAKPLVHAPPPSPYPEDVRRKGEIPPGARPIEVPAAKSNVAPAPGSTAAAIAGASAYRWTAPGARRDVGASEVKPLEAARPIPSDVPRALSNPEVEEEPTTDDRYPVLDADDATLAADEPPRPSWEGSSLLEDAADEPVDAYGTPLTLVEALRKSEPAPSSDAAPIVVGDDEFLDELSPPRPIVASVTTTVEVTTDDADDELDLPARPIARAVMHEIDEDVDAATGDDLDEVFEAEFEEPLAQPIAAREDEELDEADDDEEDAEDEDFEEEDFEEEDDLDAALAEEDLGDDLEDDANDESELDDALEPAARTDAPSLSPVEPAWETETEDEDELEREPVAAARARGAADDEARPRIGGRARRGAARARRRRGGACAGAARPRVRARVVQRRRSRASRRHVAAEGERHGEHRNARARPRSRLRQPERRGRGARAAPRSALFDTEPEEPAGDSRESTTERDVVLVPHAAPASAERTLAAGRTPAAARTSERSALLAEIGCLFIDRKRVAVSMLQRQYSMEFDDACRVLDELQDMGLLGPYLGGQRRDILLTREQWLGKVAVS